MWQDRRVTWKRTVDQVLGGTQGGQRAEGMGQDTGWRAAGGRRREKWQRRTSWAVGQPRRTKSYRASQCGLRLVEEAWKESRGLGAVGGEQRLLVLQPGNVVTWVELSARLFSTTDEIFWDGVRALWVVVLGWGREWVSGLGFR